MTLPADFGLKLWEVPRIWPGETVVVMASGPSMTQEQADYVKESACRSIVVNTTYKLAPWADILYAADRWWWQHYDCAPDFFGIRVGVGWRFKIDKPIVGWPHSEEAKKVFLVGITEHEGLELENPSGLCGGGNSGYQAVNLAVRLGAKRIVLLGFDLKEKCHWHEEHQGRATGYWNYEKWAKNFDTMVEPLNELGVEVINCSPDSAIEAFEKRDLEEVI